MIPFKSLSPKEPEVTQDQIPEFAEAIIATRYPYALSGMKTICSLQEAFE